MTVVPFRPRSASPLMAADDSLHFDAVPDARPLRIVVIEQDLLLPVETVKRAVAAFDIACAMIGVFAYAVLSGLISFGAGRVLGPVAAYTLATLFAFVAAAFLLIWWANHDREVRS